MPAQGPRLQPQETLHKDCSVVSWDPIPVIRPSLGSWWSGPGSKAICTHSSSLHLSPLERGSSSFHDSWRKTVWNYTVRCLLHAHTHTHTHTHTHEHTHEHTYMRVHTHLYKLFNNLFGIIKRKSDICCSIDEPGWQQATWSDRKVDRTEC